MTAMAMLSLAGIVLSIDAFGPIADNAGGIVEMTGMGESNRRVTDEIDAVGNTTKAVTKGFAIASAALAALAMIQAFQFEAAHVFSGVMELDYGLTNPAVIVGLLVGGLIPFIITGQLIDGVSRAAGRMVDEVRRQFKADPGILTGESKPDYASCVDIATAASMRELWKPAAVAIASPIVLGVVLGPTAVAGLLTGSVVTGIFLAYHLANTGGAWDNAKKLVEMQGRKGSEEHKVAVGRGHNRRPVQGHRRPRAQHRHKAAQHDSHSLRLRVCRRAGALTPPSRPTPARRPASPRAGDPARSRALPCRGGIARGRRRRHRRGRKRKMSSEESARSSLPSFGCSTPAPLSTWRRGPGRPASAELALVLGHLRSALADALQPLLAVLDGLRVVLFAGDDVEVAWCARPSP